jgi:membrane protease YdiL (CAAX protease family)
MYSIAYFLSKFYRTDIKAYYIFVSVAGAPLMEEILFRGFLLTLLPGSTKEKIVFSSIIFGLYHAKNYFIKTRFSLIYQIIYATLIAGPIFAFSYIKTGSLIFPIILHSVNNLLALFISEKMVRKLGAKLLI